jgi:type VI secretion system VasD/TssJ family lipoprotein
MNGGHGTRVMVIQLSGDVAFRNTPIEAFWGKGPSALREDLVGRRQEMLLFPLETRGMVVETDPQARFLAVAVNLRNPEADTWRWIRSVDDVRRDDLCVNVGERRVTVDPC